MVAVTFWGKALLTSSTATNKSQSAARPHQKGCTCAEAALGRGNRSCLGPRLDGRRAAFMGGTSGQKPGCKTPCWQEPSGPGHPASQHISANPSLCFVHLTFQAGKAFYPVFTSRNSVKDLASLSPQHGFRADRRQLERPQPPKRSRSYCWKKRHSGPFWQSTLEAIRAGIAVRTRDLAKVGEYWQIGRIRRV